MTADFKCCASPQQNTGVFRLNGAVFAVIVCDAFLLSFTLSLAAVVFLFRFPFADVVVLVSPSSRSAVLRSTEQTCTYT